MESVRKAIGKIFGISIACAVLDVVLHALLAPTFTYDYPASWFVTSGLFRPAAGLGLLLIFVLLGVVFVSISKDMPGSRLLKGLRFGTSLGGMWLIGVPGMTIFFGSPLVHEILGGACDCVSIIVLGALLGVMTAEDSPEHSCGCVGKMAFGIAIVSVVFIIGQYLAFLFMSKAPYFSLSALSTFAWTVVLGLWAGVVYWLLREGTGVGKSPAGRALFFGGFIVGIDWLLFNLFVLLFIAVPVTDPVILGGVNILSIIAGVYIAESFPFMKDACLS